MHTTVEGVTIIYGNSPPCLAALAAGDASHPACPRLGDRRLVGERLYLQACMCPCHIDAGHTFACAHADVAAHPRYWEHVTANWRRGGDFGWDQIEEALARLTGPDVAPHLAPAPTSASDLPADLWVVTAEVGPVRLELPLQGAFGSWFDDAPPDDVSSQVAEMLWTHAVTLLAGAATQLVHEGDHPRGLRDAVRPGSSAQSRAYWDPIWTRLETLATDP